MQVVEEFEIKSNPDEIQRFISSPVWKEITELLADRLARIQNELIDSDDEKQIFRDQGECVELKYLLGLPTEMLKISKEERNAA